MMKAGKLGIIGGVGPEATARFMELVIKNTRAAADQEHIPMIVFNDTRIPDRTAYILGKSQDSPLPFMLEDARKLEELGCDVLTIPCNTAHYFYNEVAASVNIPVINILEETVEECLRRKPGLGRLGLMATDGTVRSGVYEKYARERGAELLIPDGEDQKDVMRLIYDQVKAGREVDMNLFWHIVRNMEDRGCELVILGCTELSVINSSIKENGQLVDPMEVMAKRAVLMCGRELR